MNEQRRNMPEDQRARYDPFTCVILLSKAS